MTYECLSFTKVALRSSSWALEAPTALSCSFKTMKSMKMSAPAGKKYFFEEPLLVALNYVYEIIR